MTCSSCSAGRLARARSRKRVGSISASSTASQSVIQAAPGPGRPRSRPRSSMSASRLASSSTKRPYSSPRRWGAPRTARHLEQLERRGRLAELHDARREPLRGPARHRDLLPQLPGDVARHRERYRLDAANGPTWSR